MISEYLLTLLVVVSMVSAFVLLYHWQTGIYPGSKMIITDPPISHNGLEPTQAKFMFFHTPWCPWCKKAEGPWTVFKQQLKNNPVLYGGYEVAFEEINGDVDKGKVAVYRIEAFPTFKVETTTKVYEMKGVPDALTFDAFLVSALGKKTPKNSSSG